MLVTCSKLFLKIINRKKKLVHSSILINNNFQFLHIQKKCHVGCRMQFKSTIIIVLPRKFTYIHKYIEKVKSIQWKK